MNTNRSEIYVLDTNVFIEAHRRYYSLDICPGFWDCLAHHCQTPRLISIDRVRAEIDAGDALHAWIERAPEALFDTTADEEVVRHFGDMMAWVQANPQFRPEAKAKFAQDADGWVIAYAKAKDSIVVTHETFDSNARKRVPMPNVCRQFNVPYVDTFDMLRALEARFGWSR